jgi:CubicO group peptidase (beta-lactamase class C family)
MVPYWWQKMVFRCMKNILDTVIRGQKTVITATTTFQIASTSKPFTGAAVLRLVQEGKIDLNAGVEQYIPGFPYPEITVKSLLNHRSGLPNYLYYMEKGGWNRKVMANNEDVINTLIEMAATSCL